MVKPLSFKGDKKPKKRKRAAADSGEGASGASKDRALVAAAEEEAANDDSWVSADTVGDISGPIMIVLPTEKPSALSCDVNGKVFAIDIENIVDANPASSEPHDVRQVWVANRVSGTESFRLKGHHGKYLSCDKIGQLSATADAVSPLESFNIKPDAETGKFQLTTLRDTYISSNTAETNGKLGVQIRGDAETESVSTTVRVRMQARFKPKLKASKEEKLHSKISRRELEEAAGRRLEEDEVRILKRARKEGDYHERLLEIKVKNKHDKFG
ncbi:unnamed protein product [Clonostachys rosea]|uniref:Actin-crosslinking protein n=1 Tax=Bionectria ochroleuca TaxID=29856 RepID=A0ABY6UY96_BIOOC|nr:unnamed protein product [Clonostachys rosea]